MYIKSKILPVIGILKRHRNELPIDIKKSIYFSLIHSHLNYLNCIWGGANKKNIQTVKVLQNKAIKHVYNLHYRTSTQIIYHIANVLQFENLKKCNLIIFMYKLYNKLIKSEATPRLNSEIHNYCTRTANTFHIDSNRTNFGKFAILHEAIHLYNSIPNVYKSIQDLENFKLKIKEHYLKIQNE